MYFYFVAPGGSILEDPDTEFYKTDTCVFGAPKEFEALKRYYEVSFRNEFTIHYLNFSNQHIDNTF